jgi:hypothetical protein
MVQDRSRTAGHHLLHSDPQMICFLNR